MKAFKWIWVSLMILCLLCPAFSLAEAGGPRFCLPEEVDLSQVQEIDGRLKGEILLPSREGDSGSYRLLVDCPVPQGFSAKQQVRLQVEYQKIEKQQMSEALSSLGQNVSADQMRSSSSGWASRFLYYSSTGADINGSDSYSHPYTGKLCQSLSAGHEAEMAAAKDFARALLEKLGAKASEPFLQALRLTPEDVLSAYSATESSSTWYEEIRQSTEARLSGKDQVTLLRAQYELLDLPVMFQFYYQEGEDSFGESSYLELVMGDDGQLKQLALRSLPVVTAAESYPLPERSWEEWLRLWVANVWWPSSVAQDYEITGDPLYGDYTRYATEETLTAILPCWVGNEKGCLVPGWFTECRCTVLKDGSTCGYSAASLANNNLHFQPSSLSLRRISTVFDGVRLP